MYSSSIGRCMCSSRVGCVVSKITVVVSRDVCVVVIVK
jgi:hypothetical protein